MRNDLENKNIINIKYHNYIYGYKKPHNAYELIKKYRSIFITQYSGNEKILRIPQKILDMPVEGIGHPILLPDSKNTKYCKLFMNNKFMEELLIPEGILYIGSNVFNGCINLRKVRLPKSLKSIGEGAFKGCINLQKINIPTETYEIGKTAFEGCVKLSRKIQNIITERVNIDFKYSVLNEDGTQIIAITEFLEKKAMLYSRIIEGISGNNDTKKTIFIPEKINGIPIRQIKNIFTELNDLYLDEFNEPLDKTLFISAGINHIDAEAIIDFIEIEVSPKNMSFSVVNNILFDHELTELKFCSRKQTGSFSVPDGVTKIGIAAFKGCNRLTSVSIPKTVKIIDKSAFERCFNLKEVIFDKNNKFFHYENRKIINRKGETIANLRRDKTGSKIMDMPKISSETKCLFTYDFNSYLNNYQITGFKGKGKTITIPEKINDRSVSEIITHAFKGCSTITVIKIPKTIAYIGEAAFIGCRNLGSVRVDPENPNFTDIDGILYDKKCNKLIFCPQSRLGSLVLHSKTNDIAPGAVDDYSKLSKKTGKRIRKLFKINQNELEYEAHEENNEWHAVITGYRGIGGHCSIPEEIDGIKVKRIEKITGYGTGVKSISVSDEVIIDDPDIKALLIR